MTAQPTAAKMGLAANWMHKRWRHVTLSMLTIVALACGAISMTSTRPRISEWRNTVSRRISRSLTFLPAADFANGSFEDGYQHWVSNGNQLILTSDAVHRSSSGSNVVVFNLNDRTSSGAQLSQTFGTTPGVRYRLAFDLGTTGAIADQVMLVTVEGNGPLFDRTVTVAGIDDGPFYVPQNFTFVANSRRTTLTFTDKSYTYVAIDELLDNVRITSADSGTPVVESQPMRTAVAQGTDATFSVKASGEGPLRYQWQFNGHVIHAATDSSYTVAAADSQKAGNYSVVVTNASGSTPSSAATLTVLPPAILLNGSFEYGTAAWTFTRSHVAGASISTNPGYGITDGKQLAHFNWGQHEPNGAVSQRFATVPGHVYHLSFDVGAFSPANQNEQRMHVTIRGAQNLLAHEIAVFAPGNGGRYHPQSLSFIADSAATTVIFADTSRTTENVDLLLDNVRVTDGGTPTSH